MLFHYYRGRESGSYIAVNDGNHPAIQSLCQVMYHSALVYIEPPRDFFLL